MHAFEPGELQEWTARDWEEWAYQAVSFEAAEGRADSYWDKYVGREWTVRDMTKTRVLAMKREEALGQLADIYYGHRRFFQGLAWFLAQGNRLVVLRGNHDPQLYWPEVQMAFVGWIKKAYVELCRACGEPGRHELPVAAEELITWLPAMSIEDFEAQIDFDYSWFYYRDRLAYVAHGSQHDAPDAHRYFLVPVYHSEVETTFLDPGNVRPQDIRPVLDFLNSAQSVEEIDAAIEIPGERDVGRGISANLINERQRLGEFNYLDEVFNVPGVGPERFIHIVTSFSSIFP